MNSIRPLATITLLAIVGVFLYVKINEGPALQGSLVPLEPGTTEAGEGLAAAPSFSPDVGDPSVAAAPMFAPGPTGTQGAGQAEDSVAWSPPALGSQSPQDATASEFTSGAGAVSNGENMPNAPSFPGGDAVDEIDVPDFPPLPQNIPSASYDQAEPATPSADVGGPSFSFNDPATEPGPTEVGTGSGAPTPGVPSFDIGAGDSDDAELTSQFPEIPQQVSEPGGGGALGQSRAGAAPESTSPAAQANQSSTTDSVYRMTRPVIQAALDQGDLPQAHLLLSSVSRDASLADAEQREIKTLLSQLAGSVIYSQEHYLEPVCVVNSGETLETIASRYRVPWQLLAKINGIPRVDGVSPGDRLKVVQGPFAGSVWLAEREMTLNLSGRYAGQFAVAIPNADAVQDGEWVVVDKSMQPTGDQVTPVSTASPAAGPAFAKRLTLRNTSSSGGEQVTIGASPSPLASDAERHEIELASRDMDDLFDILTLGSRVRIKR